VGDTNSAGKTSLFFSTSWNHTPYQHRHSHQAKGVQAVISPPRFKEYIKLWDSIESLVSSFPALRIAIACWLSLDYQVFECLCLLCRLFST
jgi:hypothetical protein